MVKITEISCDYKVLWKFLKYSAARMKICTSRDRTKLDILYTDTATDYITPLCTCARGVMKQLFEILFSIEVHSACTVEH
jgi:hypothetical protein